MEGNNKVTVHLVFECESCELGIIAVKYIEALGGNIKFNGYIDKSDK